MSFKIDNKRFYIPDPNKVKTKCPKCKLETTVISNGSLYRPVVNEAYDKDMSCDECEHEWTVKVRLNISFELIEPVKIDQDYLNVLDIYCPDHGDVIKGVLDSDVEVNLNWTQNTWEDGVPVTKYISRCEDPLWVTLKGGTNFAGVHFAGFSTGCDVVSFRKDGTWYEALRSDAIEILEALDIEPISPDDMF
jgi:hypothetical protein